MLHAWLPPYHCDSKQSYYATQEKKQKTKNNPAVLQQESLGTFCCMLFESWEDGMARQQKKGEKSNQVSHWDFIVLRRSTPQTHSVIRREEPCWGLWGHLPELSGNHWVACCKKGWEVKQNFKTFGAQHTENDGPESSLPRHSPLPKPGSPEL